MTDAPRPRVVFDCNVLVQAASNADGPSGRCLQFLEQGFVEAFVSRASLKELRAVLAYPSVREKLRGLDDQRIEAFVQRLAFRATLIRDVPHVLTIRAPIKMKRTSTWPPPRKPRISSAAIVTFWTWPPITLWWPRSSANGFPGCPF